MKPKAAFLVLLITATFGAQLTAKELPRLSKELDPLTLTYAAQKELPELSEAYVSTSPRDLGDGLKVGTLDVPGAREAVASLVADDKAGKYQNLDSLLLWKDGKLIFEMYNRGGRVDAPHYAMSITKTLTSVTLARAIEVGLLSMEDLDKPIISFMPEIDRAKIQPGVEAITMRDALLMKSGLRFKEKNLHLTLGADNQRQQYFQKLFQLTEPVTAENKEYIKLIMDTSKGIGYFYYFHNRSKGSADKKVNFISGIGAGGQYMATFPDLNIVMVATADNKKAIGLPLQAAMDHLIPLFTE